MNNLRCLAICLCLAGSSLAFAAGDGGGGGGLLSPKPGLTFWTFVTFLALLFILSKFAWGPLLKGLDDRERHIRESAESASKNREETEKILEEARQKLKEASEEARQILEEAKTQAEKIRETNKEETEKECMRLRRQVESQVERAKERALEEIWKQVGNISVSVAERLIHKSLKGKDHSKLIDDAMKEMRDRMEAS